MKNRWKFYTVTALSSLSLLVAGCSSEVTDEGENNQDALNQSTQAELDGMSPEDYEAYRKNRAATAPTLSEFLEWATPEEIAADDLASAADEQEELARNDVSEETTKTSSLAPLDLDPSMVRIDIDVSAQRMDVSGGGIDMNDVKVTTGRQGHSTPLGCRMAFSAERNHWSRKYNAPMPYSVFFRPGIALHVGSLSVKSHGCIHLSNTVASKIYNAYRSHHAVKVCVNP